MKNMVTAKYPVTSDPINLYILKLSFIEYAEINDEIVKLTALYKYRCAHKLLDIHNMSSRMTKLSYMIKHFQINVKKRFLNF